MYNTIAEQWALFEKTVMHPNAPLIQRQEMRRAFYAGIHALLNMQYAMANYVSEDAGVAIVEGWYDECKQFGKLVAEGKA